MQRTTHETVRQVHKWCVRLYLASRWGVAERIFYVRAESDREAIAAAAASLGKKRVLMSMALFPIECWVADDYPPELLGKEVNPEAAAS